MNNKKYFNKIAKKWDDIVVHNDNKIDDMLKLLNIDSKSKVLDVGCGTGILLEKLIKKTNYVVECDISNKMLKMARQKFLRLQGVESKNVMMFKATDFKNVAEVNNNAKNKDLENYIGSQNDHREKHKDSEKKYVKFICKDALKLKLFNEFDYVICYSMFPHFENKEFALATLAKYLKQNKQSRLIIYHSQSRQQINDLHRDIKQMTTEVRLQTVAVFNEWAKISNLKLITYIDDKNEFYLEFSLR